jgi:hypothetical protein
MRLHPKRPILERRKGFCPETPSGKLKTFTATAHLLESGLGEYMNSELLGSKYPSSPVPIELPLSVIIG